MAKGAKKKVVEKEPDALAGAITPGNPVSVDDSDEDRELKFKFYTIDLPRGGKTEAKVVPVTVNGVRYELKRGGTIKNVPRGVVGVLKNAIKTEYEDQEKADKTGHEVVPVQSHSYPFAIVKGYNEKIPA